MKLRVISILCLALIVPSLSCADQWSGAMSDDAVHQLKKAGASDAEIESMEKMAWFTHKARVKANDIFNLAVNKYSLEVFMKEQAGLRACNDKNLADKLNGLINDSMLKAQKEYLGTVQATKDNVAFGEMDKAGMAWGMAFSSMRTGYQLAWEQSIRSQLKSKLFDHGEICSVYFQKASEDYFDAARAGVK